MARRTVAILCLALAAFAWQGARARALVPSGARGYWFYLLEHLPQALAQAPAPKVTPPALARPSRTPKHPKRCAGESTWTPDCGFLTPKTFTFQAKERDALLHRMVMHPGDPKAVAAFQYYLRWVVNQAIYAARVWQYNRLQNADLNPDAYSPISQYGLQLAHSIETQGRAAVWKSVKQWGGFLVVFTKQGCEWCHAQAGPLQAVAADTGLAVYDASLQGGCLPAFSGKDKAGAPRCSPPSMSVRPAEALHVSVVPTVFLWLPKNLWLRVGVGLTTTDAIESRVYNFFVAWRVAASTGRATGATGLDLDPHDRPPTIGDLRRILSKSVSRGP